MDDNNICQNCVNNILGLVTIRVCNEILEFMNKFSACMAVMGQDIYSFFMEIHSSNSARPPNANILIPPNVSQSFKSFLLDFKYRQICGALPNELVLQAIDILQPNVIHNTIKVPLELIPHRKYQSFQYKDEIENGFRLGIDSWADTYRCPRRSEERRGHL